MNRLTVAAVQQRMHIPSTIDDFADNLRRFLRIAQNRHAHLVVFPELAGDMVALAVLDDTRSNLLKRAERGARREASLWQRVTGAWSARLAGYMRADLRRSLAGMLDVSAAQVWQNYVELFGSLAREYAMTLVAPSAYLPDPVDGVIRNQAAVFGASGEVLGTQAKVLLPAGEADLVKPGASWDVIQTDVGRIGLILGGDVLYPEVGRLLAYQGADVLVGQSACRDLVMFNKVRAGVLARMQDNQLFAVASFLVGRGVLDTSSNATFAGKSAVFAPQELTPKFNGVLVEMGGPNSEGVVTAEWDFDALRELWETSDTPIRRTLSSGEIGSAVSAIYARLQRLPPITGAPQITQVSNAPSADASAQPSTLDELAVVDSYQRQFIDLEFEDDADFAPATGEDGAQAAAAPNVIIDADEETDEYDSVAGPDDELTGGKR